MRTLGRDLLLEKYLVHSSIRTYISSKKSSRESNSLTFLTFSVVIRLLSNTTDKSLQSY